MGPEPGVMSDMTFRISSMVILSAGTLFAMWIGERITDGGIGNGISILIMIGILAELPGAIVREFTRLLGGEGGGMIFFVVETAVLFSIVMVVILLVQGTRRIPIQYAKRNVMRGGRMMQAGGVRQYLPMKVNASSNADHLRSGYHVCSRNDCFLCRFKQRILKQFVKPNALVVQLNHLFLSGWLHLFLYRIGS